MAHTVPAAPSPISLDLRQEALRLLDGRGAILETARELTSLMRAAGIDGAVIGGIAVVLYGHVRTTRDIDVFLDGPAGPFVDLLGKAGFVPDPTRREFVRAVASENSSVTDRETAHDATLSLCLNTLEARFLAFTFAG